MNTRQVERRIKTSLDALAHFVELTLRLRDLKWIVAASTCISEERVDVHLALDGVPEHHVVEAAVVWWAHTNHNRRRRRKGGRGNQDFRGVPPTAHELREREEAVNQSVFRACLPDYL